MLQQVWALEEAYGAAEGRATNSTGDQRLNQEQCLTAHKAERLRNLKQHQSQG